MSVLMIFIKLKILFLQRVFITLTIEINVFDTDQMITNRYLEQNCFYIFCSQALSTSLIISMWTKKFPILKWKKRNFGDVKTVNYFKDAWCLLIPFIIRIFHNYVLLAKIDNIKMYLFSQLNLKQGEPQCPLKSKMKVGDTESTEWKSLCYSSYLDAVCNPLLQTEKTNKCSCNRLMRV